MIVVLIGFLIAWHLSPDNDKNPGEEMEERFLHEMEYEMSVHHASVISPV